MVIVIKSVIGGFGWVELVWLATSTVRLQVSDYSQLSDYRCPITAKCPITVNCPITLFDYSSTEWLVKNKAANALIMFEEIVMVMIKKTNSFYSLYIYIYISEGIKEDASISLLHTFHYPQNLTYLGIKCSMLW